MDRGERIRKRREELGISQAELARGLSKTRSLISYIEKTGKVNDLTYLEIIRFLGISPETEEDKLLFNRFDKIREPEASYSELEFLRSENRSLKEIIELQKSVIEMLKKKAG